jgi:hypothetical protein
VLYFERSDLATQLRVPLARTLPLTTPPLPTDPDHAESTTIDRLTLKHVYGFDYNPDGQSAEFVLFPDF